MQVDNGLRPITGDCPDEMKQLITLCWDADDSKRPCKFSNVLFVMMIRAVSSQYDFVFPGCHLQLFHDIPFA